MMIVSVGKAGVFSEMPVAFRSGLALVYGRSGCIYQTAGGCLIPLSAAPRMAWLVSSPRMVRNVMKL